MSKSSSSVVADIQTKLRDLQFQINEFKAEFKEFVEKTEKRFTFISEAVDGLVGDFKKFDEEQTVLSHRQSGHSDRIEKLEEKVFGVAQA